MRDLEEQLDAIAREHEGDALVAEVERLAARLSAAERELLQELLVARSRADAYALERRIDEKRLTWLQSPPEEPGRAR